jgi:hypothetical protein
VTRDDAEETIAALGRAIVALSADPPDTKTAGAEIAEALDVLVRGPNPYADKSLRPGLNPHRQLPWLAPSGQRRCLSG